jgi:hypothetical protein
MAGSTGTPRFTYMFAAAWLLALASPASAVTYAKFYSGGTGYSGPYDGAGAETTVYENTRLLSTDCPDTGGCGSPTDRLQDPMTFSGAPNLTGGPTITATASGPAANQVWDDLVPIFGGLGVGTLTQFNSQSDADQIAGDDLLVITFSEQVRLLGVGTLFASGHLPFSGEPGPFDTVAEVSAAQATIAFLLNGSDQSFQDANRIGLSLEGTVFTFQQKDGGPQFYVSALAFETCDGASRACGNTEVPIPGALPLFVSALGALGLLAWRRNRKPMRAPIGS